MTLIKLSEDPSFQAIGFFSKKGRRRTSMLLFPASERTSEKCADFEFCEKFTFCNFVSRVLCLDDGVALEPEILAPFTVQIFSLKINVTFAC